MSPVDSSIARPQLPALTAVLPAEPLLLMTAGPVPVPAEVARAGGMVIDHLGDTMNMVIRHIKELSRYAFQTRDENVFGVSGPASAAMEMAVTNLLWPGRRVLVLKNGLFSGRFAEMAAGVGAEVEILEESVQLARDHGALTIVDAVCTLSTMPLKKDEWGIDVVFTGSQKGLSSLPGVSLISFSDEAWRMAKTRQSPHPHWCLDIRRAQEFWGGQKYHYTAPVPGLLALHEALRLILEETLERRFDRHLHSSLALQAGVEAMGLQLAMPPQHRLNSVLAIDIPGSANGDEIRKYMSMMFKVQISGSFGLSIFRIGQMGEQCRAPNLFRVLHALGVALARQGIEIDQSAGMAALESHLAEHAEDIL